MVKKATEARPNHLLRAARKQHSWTQKEVADRIGAPLSLNITRWERGTAFPSAHYVEQLCRLFGKSPQELGLLQPEDEEPPADPQHPWNVPFNRNPFFTGRDELLLALHERLGSQHVAAITQSQALTGLGGIGKTQTAIEYAYRYRGDYSAVFWVRAASHETLVADFVALGSLVQLPGQDTQDQNALVSAVKRWLNQYPGWLLILDNADDLALIPEFMPIGSSGHVLLTTRAQATGQLAGSLAVEKMGRDEGV